MVKWQGGVLTDGRHGYTEADRPLLVVVSAAEYEAAGRANPHRYGDFSAGEAARTDLPGRNPPEAVKMKTRGRSMSQRWQCRSCFAEFYLPIRSSADRTRRCRCGARYLFRPDRTDPAADHAATLEYAGLAEGSSCGESTPSGSATPGTT